VNNAITGLSVFGGVGADTLFGNGITFTADQREQIFGQGSVETITDDSGTYAAPAAGANTFVLTTGNDSFSDGSAVDNEIRGTASTLNNGDQLDGGGGTDALVLYGAGTYRLDSLAQFEGMEEVRLVNGINATTDLYLRDGVDLFVTGSSQRDYFYLGTGKETINAGGGSDFFWAYSNDDLDGDVLDGGAGTDYIRLQTSSVDLTPVSLQNIEYIQNYSSNSVTQIDQATVDSVGVGFQGTATARFRTSDATLDLTGKSVFSVGFDSDNATGTTFTVNNANTGLFVFGGPGEDTLVGTGLTFTSTQKAQVFNAGSIEIIQDQSGIYGNNDGNNLVGDNSNNSIDGAGGNDTVDGAGGDDFLVGGSGDDLFVFGSGDGDDTIADFTVGQDALLLEDGILVDSLQEQDVNGDSVVDTTVHFDSGDKVDLLGVSGIAEGELFS
jgi:Ca2+-binding RTX toxin-like protein